MTTLQPDLRAVRSRPAAATERARRWMLSRAGIVNVYQYGNEILHFAGGRLLLRGVNGSGQSTAMNMLLPFLLDADTRRIDAAGEQSGVLRSWMLSGRNEHFQVVRSLASTEATTFFTSQVFIRWLAGTVTCAFRHEAGVRSAAAHGSGRAFVVAPGAVLPGRHPAPACS